MWKGYSGLRHYNPSTWKVMTISVALYLHIWATITSDIYSQFSGSVTTES